MPPITAMLCMFNASQQDGEYRKQMDASIQIQGHGLPAAELLQQVALLSPGATSYKTRSNICFLPPRWCICEEMTQNTQTRTAVFSGSDFDSPRVTFEQLPQRRTDFVLDASSATQRK